jgi:hypothetical protein
MSRYLVNDPPVPIYEFDPAEVISESPPNVIYIRSKMDSDADARYKNVILGMGDDGAIERNLGMLQLALLLANIVSWSGPDLDSVPCTQENIRKLDPAEPHLALVLEEIARRNKRPEAPSPKSATASTSASAGGVDSAMPAKASVESQSLLLATGKQRSS